MPLRFWPARKPPEAPPQPAPVTAAPVLDEAAEALLRRIEWQSLRKLDGVLQGDYRTLFRGTGTELADLREYQHHDDVRHIDWNVTARMQTPYVRQYNEDRDLTAWFLVDLSASADFGSSQRNKRDLTVQLVALLSRLLTQRGNRCGLILYGLHGNTVGPVIPPGSGRRHVLQMLHAMRVPQPVTGIRGIVAKNGKRVAPGPTQLATLLLRACESIKRRCAVVLVSDFISEDGWAQPLMQLAARQDVLAVQVTDTLEQQLPDLGLMTLEDPETGEQLFIDTADPALRARFETLARERTEQLQSIFSRAGVDSLQLRTDEALIDSVLRFVQTRKQRLSTGSSAYSARRT